MIKVIVEGWLLGLATGPYCLGACAPFMVPYVLAEGSGSWRRNVRIVGQFLVGRLTAYLLFGAVAGWAAGLLRPQVAQPVSRVALGLTSVLMVIYAVDKRAPRWQLCGRWLPVRGGRRLPWLLGFLVGINVCPPFLAGIARLLQLGAVDQGLLFFFAFFGGTSVYVLPLLALSPLTGLARLQRVGTLSAILIGTWLFVAAWLGL